MIQIKNLNITYKIYKKEPGLVSSIKGIFKRKYEYVEALKCINLNIDKGEIVGLIGTNGAGKTTLLKSISGLLYPTSGEIFVNGFIPKERKNEFKKKISLVMGQRSQLIWDIAPIETFILNRDIYGINNDYFNNKLDELTKILDVGHCLQTPVRQLSLGERMKMELIAALIHDPKILYLDEPTIGLDLKSQMSLRNFIKDYASKNEVTIIITSHYMEDIVSLCDRVVMINSGTILFDGKLNDLYSFKSNYKYISVETEQEVIEEITDKIASYELIGNIYKIKTTEDNVNDIIIKLIGTNKIKNLEIINQPIEEIILGLLEEGDAKVND
ncbi:hypothetical protein CIW83_05520 [Tissierella sp. P1]|uniref:ABC transporter ATP-binding protein n=1 Tax=Tissierella sp. P1 TaxID=1280483 RepID=UPI000BA0E489|nr:ATP-binding cassette domain-containing protein [Tissierella sp. P1]OZV13006.1 hypothetical protein CIW83_05520 [Tissierella sp. P1]